MHQPRSISYQNKSKFYSELLLETQGLLESDWLINTSNFSALIHQHLPEINWVGFYFLRGEELCLGPFQGLPACTRIPLGRGVCGTSAQKREVVVVDDVDQFPGHIACDAASRSEIVIPLIRDEKLYGVLDIDSPVLNRFSPEDVDGLKRLVGILMEKTDWSTF